MDDVIQIHDQHYILASSARIEERTRVLKHGETFAVFDRFGDVLPIGLGEQGLYHEGTRHLSSLQLRIDGMRPLLLSSTSRGANELLIVDLTNADLIRGGETILRRGDLHVLRTKFLWAGACYERIQMVSYCSEALETLVSIGFAADFRDIFEVRGARRPARGSLRPVELGARVIVIGYEGLDRTVRRTTLRFDPAPTALSADQAQFRLTLQPHETITLDLEIACDTERPGAARSISLGWDAALMHCTEAANAPVPGRADVVSSSEPFNAWLKRSRADLHMLVSQTPQGRFPFAGVPWFSAPFGRDGVITALELLWLDPSLARGVLQMLAATQARELDPARDAEPGKILHEQRYGEMAALGEVPFGRYYGSVDSTPLYVLLAGAYYERTGDLDLVRSLWPTIERALRWIDEDGDPDRDGFVEYHASRGGGLVNQGWKDSADSVSHADGTLADGPIALVEVQGYVYAARLAAARLAEALGQVERADVLRAQAARLKLAFAERFWLPELETYALALDGLKRPCRVRTSNAGQVLFTGIAEDEHARRVANALFAEDLYSGWGIRTLSRTAARYNPMSYHNGSVWPHDNALIAAGLARIGLQHLARKLLAALYDASTYFDLRRMPELFCGFSRREDEGPTLYPVACAPQAWAAGAPFMLLAAALGVCVDAPARRVQFVGSTLPENLEHVSIHGLQVAEASLDLRFDRYPHDVGLTVLRRDHPFEVLVLK